MTDILSHIPLLGDLLGGNNQPSVPPLLQNLPSATTALNRKYSNPSLQSALQSLPPSIASSLQQYDIQRVSRGQNPLSDQQTLNALLSAKNNIQATPQEDRGFLNNAVSDIQNIVSEIPHLPFTLYNEATELPSAPSKLAEVLGRGNIQDVLGGLREVPGLRMVPGVNTVATVANEGPGAILQHPILTALDVLPYAHAPISALTESAFSRLPSVQAARGTFDLTAANAAREAANLPPIEAPSALRVAAQESPVIQALRATPPARYFARGFGSQARDLVQVYNQTAGKRIMQSNPDAPTSVLTPDTQFIRDALTDAQKWSKDIAPDRMRELTSLLETDRPTALASTNDPIELAFLNNQFDHVQAMAQYGLTRNWLKSLDGEVFETQQANRILNARRQTARFQAMTDTRNTLQDAQQSNYTDLSNFDTSPIASQHLTRDDAIQVAKGYAHTLELSGYDTAPIAAYLSGPAKAATSNAEIRTAFDDILRNNVQPAPIMPLDDIINALKPRARTDGSILRVLDNVKRGNYSAAVDNFRNSLATRTVHTIPEADQMLDSLKRYREANKYLDRTNTFTPRKLTQIQRTQQALESRFIPARFIPQVEQRVQAHFLSLYAHDPIASGYIDNQLYSMVPGLSTREVAQVRDGIARTWKDMRDVEGLDPVFIHRINPSALSSLTRPNITEHLSTPTQVRVRTLDATPHVQDAAVALTHQGMEYLSRLGQEEFTNTILNLHGAKYNDLVSRYYDAAIAANQSNPNLSVAAHLEKLINRDFSIYDPEAIFGLRGARVNLSAADRLYIPKTVDQVMRDLFPHGKGYSITGVLDPTMRLFRTSVLAFSPRWHVNNILGGAIMLTAVTNPLSIIKYFRDGVEMTKSGELHAIPGMPPGGFGSMPAEIIQWGKNAGTVEKVLAAHQFQAGQTLLRWWGESQGIRDRVTAAAEWSYKFNGFIDDMYRSIAYLYGKDKATLAGLSPEAAQQAGIALTRKVLQQWDRITPFERNVIRFAFPFYGWMNHILRYAYRYPFDHPFRTSVLGSLTRKEVDDFGQGMPQRFMDLLFLGNPDPKTGNVTAISTAALNPFKDVANYFTMAGLTGKLNPIISAGLESIGINPAQGAQDLYPEIAYDPVTGKLRPSNPNFLSSLLGNIIPQTNIVSAMIGRNEQFKQILRTNPEAAATMLRSAAGLPNLFRNVNPAQETFKAELQREQSQSDVKSEALRTGDWSRAQNFPQLRAYFQQLATLYNRNPSIFQSYVQPQSASAPSLLDAARMALVEKNVPGVP